MNGGKVMATYRSSTFADGRPGNRPVSEAPLTLGALNLLEAASQRSASLYRQ